MDKLNSLISRNKELRDKLKSSADYQEQEFVAELAELQEQSIQYESKFEDMQEEREQIDAEILETQELMNLYEKKIQQEQEMQEMLDPNVGQKEAQDMEKAIHRMKIKLAKLKRDQQDMIQQIELAIDKREALATRFRGKKDKGNSNVKKRKEAATIRRNIKSINEEIMTKDKEVALAEQELEEKEKVANQMSSEQQDIEVEVADMQENINDMLYQKQRVVDSNAMMHRLLRKYKALNAPRPPPPASPRSTVRLLSAADKKKQLFCVVLLP